MEPTASDKPKVNYYLLFAACIVVGLLILGYFQLFAKDAVPSEFFSLYDDQDSIVKKTYATMVFDYGSISRAIGGRDASAAASFSKYDLVQSLKNQQNIDNVQKRTTELKVLLPKITDATIREKVLHLFEQMDERNNRLHTVVALQTKVFANLSDHFGAVAASQKGVDISPDIDKSVQTSQGEVQSIIQLQSTIDFSYQEIVKLVGVDTTVSQTADSIRMNLSATPESNPTITDYPTSTPSPTAIPTEPVASDSAQASSSAH